MSGFDTSQPLTDEKSLEEIDTGDKAGPNDESDSASAEAEAEELGDATPGPR
ncbi:MAG: hypothetical protein NVS4B6_01550 [Mycobacterium sp.]